MAAPHAVLGTLADLVGTWVGSGTGRLPGEPEFHWDERLEVTTAGTPALAFHQRTTRPDGSPFHAEDGWVRVPPERQDDDAGWNVELAVASPTGILEALEGRAHRTADGVELTAASTTVARTAVAREVLSTARRWMLADDVLVVEFHMATPNHPEPFHHLTAELHRRD